MSNFLKATKKKLRFTTNKGSLSTEQLWDLSLDDLDTLGKSIRKKINEDQDESLIGKQTRASADDVLRFNLIKDVIEDKITERDARVRRAEKAEEIAKIQDAIAKQLSAEFDNTDLNTLQARLAKLTSED